MKILHIITRMIVGGAQENTLLTCEGLAARGHEVVLLTGPTTGPEGTLMDRAYRGGYDVRVTPHLVRSPHPWHDWMAYREIRRIVRELQPDVVHTHSSKAGIIGRGAAWGALTDAATRRRGDAAKTQSGAMLSGEGAPLSMPIARGRPIVIHTIHGLAFGPFERPAVNRLWIHLERWAARRCDALISVADAMTRQALAEGIGRPAQYETIYSGMDVQPFLNPGTTAAQMRAALGIPPQRIVFGTIARLQPLKGHDDLLAAAGELFAKVPEAHFLWLGNGVFRERFERTIREKSWQDHFTLPGLVPPADVPRMIAAMDVVVHPSYREGLARALPQALLAARPVISYDCDGAAEVCLDGQTGRLVKTGDAAALGAAMLWMAQHPDQRLEMARRGQVLCLERFPADVMVGKIEALYKRLVAETK